MARYIKAYPSYKGLVLLLMHRRVFEAQWLCNFVQTGRTWDNVDIDTMLSYL